MKRTVALFLALTSILSPSAQTERKSADVTEILPPPGEMPSVAEGRRTRSAVFQKEGVLRAITPLADVEFARVRAVLPDGREIFVTEIRRFRKSENRTLLLQKPVNLPKGARITTEPSVRLELLVGPPAPSGKAGK